MHYHNLPNSASTAEKRRKARAHPRPKYHNLLNIFCHEIKLLNNQFCKAHAAPLRQNSNATTEPRDPVSSFIRHSSHVCSLHFTLAGILICCSCWCCCCDFRHSRVTGNFRVLKSSRSQVPRRGPQSKPCKD